MLRAADLMSIVARCRGQILEKIDEELRGADDLPSAGAANALAGAVCLEQLDSSQVRHRRH